MRHVWKKRVAAGAAALVLGGGMILMQSAAAATRANRSVAERPARTNALSLLAAQQGNVECANTADGVKLIITTDQPTQVARLQQQVNARVAKLGQAAERGGRRASGAEGLMAMIAAGELKLSAENIDSGAVITLSSSDAGVVKRLQTEMARMVAARKALLAAIEETRQFDSLVASGKVTIDVQQTNSGVNVSIASNDPKLAGEIKANLPAYFEGMSERARLMEQWMRTRGGANAPARRKDAQPPHNQ